MDLMAADLEAVKDPLQGKRLQCACADAIKSNWDVSSWINPGLATRVLVVAHVTFVMTLQRNRTI